MSTQPKYVWIAETIASQILKGDMAPGVKLPPVRTMADNLNVTPGTVARAYRELTDQGYLTAGVGQGTFVRDLRAKTVSRLNSDDRLILTSPRIPDMGQTDIIRHGFAQFSKVADLEHLIGYPTRTDTKGVRTAFKDWIGDTPLGGYDIDDMVLTQGGQHAGVSILQTLQRVEWSKVMVDCYSYSGFREAALLAHSDIFSISGDEFGPIPEEFERVATETGAKIYFTSAEVNNPTTVFTDTRRRHQIAMIADRLGISIIEDDCFRLGPYLGETYRSLLPHTAWYLTSVSKPLTPALRIGVAVAPKGQAQNLETSINFSTLGVSQAIQFVTQYVLTHKKRTEIQEAVRQEVMRYVSQTVNILGQFDLRWREDVSFFWLYLPRGWRTADFCRAASEGGVAILPAENFILRSDNAPDAVRICINAEHGIERYIEGIEVLADLLRNPVGRTLV